MFGQDRDSLRRYYMECWQKHLNKQPLDTLQQQIVRVISEHPEYHQVLMPKDQNLQKEFFPEMGQVNPFLHMGLHLGLREQVSTNRPAGITTLYQELVVKYGAHDAEHRMMDCLAESIWSAQRNQRAPDEVAYLDCLKNQRG